MRVLIDTNVLISAARLIEQSLSILHFRKNKGMESTIDSMPIL